MTPEQIESLPREAQLEAIQLLEELERRRKADPLSHYQPSDKQREFHNQPPRIHEKAMIAANRSGKTMAAAYEVAIHATGRYPSWWEGRRFDRPINAVVVGGSAELVRDTCQKYLCGSVADPESGCIPQSDIVSTSTQRGVANTLDTVVVRHASGGNSQINFRSYLRGRERLQGLTSDLIWCDEEPPADVYSELLTRLATTGGLMALTMTPLQGMSDVCMRFLEEEAPDRSWVQIGLRDVTHMSHDEIERVIASFPEHEREARSEGTPMLGSGRIWPYPESDYTFDPELVDVPRHFPRIIGLDVGLDHPSAACLCVWDRESDTFYILATHRKKDAPPMVHANAMRAWGNYPVAYGHDLNQRQKDTNTSMATAYREQGLFMLDKHATMPDGSNSLEASVIQIGELMMSGRFMIAKHLSDLLEEIRGYHRRDGRIVALRDDIISSMRYAWMMRRFAQVHPGPGGDRMRRHRQTRAHSDYQIFDRERPRQTGWPISDKEFYGLPD